MRLELRAPCRWLCALTVLLGSLGMRARDGATPPTGPVSLQGIVHTRLLRPNADGSLVRALAIEDPRTRVGYIVYVPRGDGFRWRGQPVNPRPGDRVNIRGRWQVFDGQPAVVDAVLRHHAPGTADLDTLLPAVELDPPAELALAGPYWRALAGRRCRLPAGCVVMGSDYAAYWHRRSELVVVRPDNPLLARPDPSARRVFRDAHPLDDQPVAPPAIGNGNGFRIAVGDQGLRGASDDPFANVPRANTGDRLPDPVTGTVLCHGPFCAFQPATPFRVVPGAAPAPPRRPPPGLHIASFNVENLYDFRNDPFDPADDFEDLPTNQPPRLQNYVPADEATYRARLDGLARQIARDLGGPDVLLVQEIEDQDIGAVVDGQLVIGAVNNRDGAPDVLQELAAAIRTGDGPAYAILADRAGADERGIMNALLYRPDRLRPVTPRPDDPLLGAGLRVNSPHRLLEYQAGPVNPRAINAVGEPHELIFSRAPLVACLAGPATGDRPLYVIVNHFKSIPDQFVAVRTEQARVVAALAAALLAEQPDALVAVGGDLNTLPRPDEPIPAQPADQLGALYATGLYNVYDRVLAERPASAYSYVFQGQAGTLDHLFLSPALRARLRFADYTHINSDFHGAAPAMGRGWSDHDPVSVVIAP